MAIPIIWTGAEGELRFVKTKNTTIIQADLDGDMSADIEIELHGKKTLHADDFFL